MPYLERGVRCSKSQIRRCWISWLTKVEDLCGYKPESGFVWPISRP